MFRKVLLSSILFISLNIFCQNNIIDSLSYELKNSLFYTIDEKPHYLEKYDFKNVYNGQKFISSISDKFELSLYFVDFTKLCGFTDVVVEGFAKSDVEKYYSFITTLAIIEELHERGILHQTAEKYFRDQKALEEGVILKIE